jgi:hypothetical protein
MYLNNLGGFLLLNPDYFFGASGPAQKEVLAPFWGWFSWLSPPQLFNPRGISVGAFSGVENAKIWGSSPEMPKAGSPLAKGEWA